MLLADALSYYAPQNGPEVALDIAIYHVHITHEKKVRISKVNPRSPTPAHSCWDKSGRMVWECLWCAKCAKVIPPVSQWNDSWVWLDLKRWRPHYSPNRKGEDTTQDTWGTSRHHQMPVSSMALHLLARHQPSDQMHGRIMCSMSTTLTTRTMATTQTNTGTTKTMATHQCWLLLIQWFWVPSYCWLLLKDTICKKDAPITV